MGSTLPLLLMEETMFSRVGLAAESFATGCRPVSSTRTYARMPAARRNSRSRLRSLRSIFLWCLLLLAAHGDNTQNRCPRNFQAAFSRVQHAVPHAPMNIILTRAAELAPPEATAVS